MTDTQLHHTHNGNQRRWPDWIGNAAAVWAAIYTVAALVWTVTGNGFPFGKSDPDSEISVLHNLSAEVGAPTLAGLMIVTTVAMLVMAGRQPVNGLVRNAMLGLGWLVTAVLLLVVPTASVLTLVGYAPMLILGAPFGIWDKVNPAEVFTWPLLNQVFAIVGGFLIAGATLAWQRRTRGACVYCGRSETTRTWTTPAGAARWGRWAVAVAALVPLLYAVDRFAWLVGIPLLIDDRMLDYLHESGAVWAGAGLGAFAAVGAVLTLGLAQRWGERFPRWMRRLRGKPVPIGLAVVPASVVAVLVTSTGLSMTASPKLAEALGGPAAPLLAFPVWGVALAAATYAYYLRRRGACIRCGRE